jgi:hypothetical protein
MTIAEPASTPLAPTTAFVRRLLCHPEDHPWVMQDIGLLGLRLDESRVHRLHVWDPTACVEEAPVHDHPFDFTSTVIAGQITNTRYEESATGVAYQRDRYAPPSEDERAVDTIRLSARSTTFTTGERYSQRAGQLHSSSQILGTVTLLRRTFTDVGRLTVCRPPGSPWVPGRSRPASAAEIRRITAAALDLMG